MAVERNRVADAWVQRCERDVRLHAVVGDVDRVRHGGGGAAVVGDRQRDGLRPRRRVIVRRLAASRGRTVAERPLVGERCLGVEVERLVRERDRLAQPRRGRDRERRARRPVLDGDVMGNRALRRIGGGHRERHVMRTGVLERVRWVRGRAVRGSVAEVPVVGRGLAGRRRGVEAHARPAHWGSGREREGRERRARASAAAASACTGATRGSRNGAGRE